MLWWALTIPCLPRRTCALVDADHPVSPQADLCSLVDADHPVSPQADLCSLVDADHPVSPQADLYSLVDADHPVSSQADLCSLVGALPLPELELLWRWGAADDSSFHQLLLEDVLLRLLEDADQRVQQAAAAALVRSVMCGYYWLPPSGTSYDTRNHVPCLQSVGRTVRLRDRRVTDRWKQTVFSASDLSSDFGVRFLRQSVIEKS